MFDLNRYLKERAELVQKALERAVAADDGADARLFDAMRYSLLGGGKRLRPILALAACEAVGGALEAALGLACAVEMIHTYSLIHDDLPCMDNDDLRHGRPTNHKVYGDAIATLAGDALVTDAFKILARSALDGVAVQRVLATVAELSEAAGSGGMVGGQVIDILSERKRLGLDELKLLHSKKTGAMFRASILGGARLGGASDAELEALDAYAHALGLAFQVVDDILDIEATTEQMGKRTGKDEAAGKNTFPALMGLEESHGFARELERRAHDALAGFGARAQALRQIATFVVERGR
ncbi:MAG TPA: farnesyl diphosphate synthase [Candidatus Binataceae bacterium]|nr:farnesyl diphosphate synthase [Candidatus Binataceae bacterium]